MEDKKLKAPETKEELDIYIAEVDRRAKKELEEFEREEKDYDSGSILIRASFVWFGYAFVIWAFIFISAVLHVHYTPPIMYFNPYQVNRSVASVELIGLDIAFKDCLRLIEAKQYNNAIKGLKSVKYRNTIDIAIKDEYILWALAYAYDKAGDYENSFQTYKILRDDFNCKIPSSFTIGRLLRARLIFI